MGRAIVRSPKAFLMDEPLSNLDAKLRVQMRTEIARLQQRLGTTTVYVTHDQTEAMTLGDRVVVLRGGVVQQIGAPQDLYDHPANLFVAGFIGSPSMNFFPGSSPPTGVDAARRVHAARPEPRQDRVVEHARRTSSSGSVPSTSRTCGSSTRGESGRWHLHGQRSRCSSRWVRTSTPISRRRGRR